MNDSVNIIKIENYFNPSDIRPDFRSPFNYNGRTIATDGRALLSVPINDRFNDHSGKLNKKLNEIFTAIREADFKPIPKLEMPEPTNCKCCKGSGRAQRNKCPECDGEGEVDAETDYNTYYGLECITCKGDGHVVSLESNDDCPECRGKGKLIKSDIPIHIKGMHVSMGLLEKILKADGIEIAANPTKSMLLFKGGEAEGALMSNRA